MPSSRLLQLTGAAICGLFAAILIGRAVLPETAKPWVFASADAALAVIFAAAAYQTLFSPSRRMPGLAPLADQSVTSPSFGAKNQYSLRTVGMSLLWAGVAAAVAIGVAKFYPATAHLSMQAIPGMATTFWAKAISVLVTAGALTITLAWWGAVARVQLLAFFASASIDTALNSTSVVHWLAWLVVAAAGLRLTSVPMDTSRLLLLSIFWTLGLFSLWPAAQLLRHHTFVRRFQAVLVVVCGLLVCRWGFVHILYGLRESVIFSGRLADGCFQVLDPLRRVAAGQRPGVDFQLFHGLAIPYLHYPLFAALGGTIAASEISRHVVALLSCFAVVGILVWATPGRRLIVWPLVAVLLLVYDVFGLAVPGNSLMTVRTTLPIMIFALLWRGLPEKWEPLVMGLLLGLAALVSIEQGLAVNVAFFGWQVVRCFQSRRHVIYLLSAGLMMTLTVSLVYLIVAGPAGTLAMLKYHFVSVPADQGWYFGSPPNESLASARAWIMTPRPVLTAAVCFLLLVRSVYKLHYDRRPLGEDRRQLWATTVALSYALLSLSALLGLLTAGSAVACERMLVAVAFVHVPLLLERRSSNWVAGLRVVGAGAVLIASLTWTLYGPIARRGYTATTPLGLIRETSTLAEQIQAGGWNQLSPRLQQHVETLTEAIDAHTPAGQTPTLWSTYRGPIELHYGLLPPEADYIIHALGPQGREDYLNAFRATAPRFVQTFRYDSEFAYEEWLQQTTWPFYEEILEHYEVIATTGYSLLWQRTDNAGRVRGPSVEATVRDNRRATFTPAEPLPATAIVVCELEYELRNPWKSLPLLGGTVRFLASAEHADNLYGSYLPPYRQKVEFPIYPKPGVDPGIVVEAQSLLPGAAVTLHAARFRWIDAGGAYRWLDPKPFTPPK